MARNIADWAKDRDRERRALGAALGSKRKPTGKKQYSKVPKIGTRRPKFK